GTVSEASRIAYSWPNLCQSSLISGTGSEGTAIMPFDSATLSMSSKPKPLVVDLDGTLVRSDLLVESTFAHLGLDPLRIVGVLSAMGRGKAALKAEIAAKTEIDVSHLPYDEEDEYRLHICYTANINICVGPSIVDGSGWIEMMPRAHNGYLDVRLETGLIGF